jgi:hypothetical protein
VPEVRRAGHGRAAGPSPPAALRPSRPHPPCAPQVFVDTTGWAFAYPLAWRAGCRIAAYVHYPTGGGDGVGQPGTGPAHARMPHPVARRCAPRSVVRHDCARVVGRCGVQQRRGRGGCAAVGGARHGGAPHGRRAELSSARAPPPPCRVPLEDQRQAAVLPGEGRGGAPGGCGTDRHWPRGGRRTRDGLCARARASRHPPRRRWLRCMACAAAACPRPWSTAAGPRATSRRCGGCRAGRRSWCTRPWTRPRWRRCRWTASSRACTLSAWRSSGPRRTTGCSWRPGRRRSGRRGPRCRCVCGAAGWRLACGTASCSAGPCRPRRTTSPAAPPLRARRCARRGSSSWAACAARRTRWGAARARGGAREGR